MTIETINFFYFLCGMGAGGLIVFNEDVVRISPRIFGVDCTTVHTGAVAEPSCPIFGNLSVHNIHTSTGALSVVVPNDGVGELEVCTLHPKTRAVLGCLRSVCIAAFNDEAADVIAIVGLTVSTLRVKVLLLSDPSAFSLPAESENFDEATLITPSVVLLSVGVNVAV